MTKKHFIKLVDTIIIANHNAKLNGKKPPFGKQAIAELGCFCQRQSSDFNSERWFNYIAGTCGSNGGAIKKGK